MEEAKALISASLNGTIMIWGNIETSLHVYLFLN